MGRFGWVASITWAAGLLAWAGAGHAWAGGLNDEANAVDEAGSVGAITHPAHAWQAVSEDKLDDMRGGFDIPSAANLRISFGIDRAVYINGDLVANVSVTIPDITRITAEQAHQLANVVNTVNLVQNGPNNTFTPNAGAGAAATTVIQNTLNNQTLQSLTTISAAVNSLPQFRQLNLTSTLQSALANVVNLH